MATLNVRVLFFGSLREAVRADEMVVAAAPDATVAGLRERLVALLPDAAGQAVTGSEVRITVNQEFVHGLDAALVDGDEVGFLPPVTGG